MPQSRIPHVLVVASGLLLPAVADADLITSTAPQSGLTSSGSPPTEIATFDFAGTDALLLTSLDRVSITMQVGDGDTGPDDGTGTPEIDFNDWTLGLDGFDTGILLNGFTDGQVVTQTLSGIPNDAVQILAALKADRQLVATIIDADNARNDITLPVTFDAVLTLDGVSPAAVPEPATLLLGLLGTLGLAARRRRAGAAP